MSSFFTVTWTLLSASSAFGGTPVDLSPYKYKLGRIVVATRHPERIAWDFRKLSGEPCYVDYSNIPFDASAPVLFVNAVPTKTYYYTKLGKTRVQEGSITNFYLHEIPVHESWEGNFTYSCTDWQVSHTELQGFTDSLILTPNTVEFKTTYSCRRKVLGSRKVEESLKCIF